MILCKFNVHVFVKQIGERQQKKHGEGHILSGLLINSYH